MSNQGLSLSKYARSAEIMERFRDVIGSARDANAYVSSVLIAVANNNTLQECTPQSIISSALRAASLRLSCDPATGQAHLVPFKGKATLIIGYKGLIDMAIRTGKYRYLNAFPVYEGMEVTEDLFKGIHSLKGGRKSDIIIGYMLAFELLNGFSKTFYMTHQEVEKHAMRYSKSISREDSLWKTDFDKMAIKTVIRLGLRKWGYFDPSDIQHIDADEQTEAETVEGSFNDLPGENEVTPAPEPVNSHAGKSAEQLQAELGYS